jgi:hypothetical protein
LGAALGVRGRETPVLGNDYHEVSMADGLLWDFSTMYTEQYATMTTHDAAVAKAERLIADVINDVGYADFRVDYIINKYTDNLARHELAALVAGIEGLDRYLLALDGDTCTAQYFLTAGSILRSYFGWCE